MYPRLTLLRQFLIANGNNTWLGLFDSHREVVVPEGIELKPLPAAVQGNAPWDGGRRVLTVLEPLEAGELEAVRASVAHQIPGQWLPHVRKLPFVTYWLAELLQWVPLATAIGKKCTLRSLMENS